ncbi:MAG TPA: hypothetical protein VGO11_03930 [Chthoniobacteraceae bacterium]|jgi:hypothetical protein|nr:hypothetical protein [Chthoniobacteraceae bacterium]
MDKEEASHTAFVPGTASSRQIPRVLGYALVLTGATVALWLVLVALLPKAIYYVQLYQVKLPGPISAGLVRSYPDPDYVAGMVGTVGVLLLIGALFHRRHTGMIKVFRAGLAILTGAVTLLVLYLLCAGYVATLMATQQQTNELTLYRMTFEGFALLDLAEGRIEQLQARLAKRKGLRMVEVKSASEFNEDEAKERVWNLLAVLARSDDTRISKRGLATLALFRPLATARPSLFDEVPRLAVKAGAPPGQSLQECLEWMAANSNKDGWEPLPLFKLTR